MSNSQFDLIVIGTGPAASTVATKVGRMGKRVAIIESREFGGTCALRGCNPKKVYTNAAQLVDRARGSKGKLVDFSSLGIDWGQLLAFKREFTEPIVQTKRESYEKKGIATFRGSAHFSSPKSVKVDEQTLTAERIFIGVGAQPRPLELPGGRRAIHSDEFLDMTSLPKRIVFIGGGYISMEFACVAARYGSSVKVLQSAAQVLPEFDSDLVAHLVAYSEQHGVEINTRSKVKALESAANGSSTMVRYQTSDQPHAVEADLVVHGAGRIPNVHELHLQDGQVAFGKQGIAVDSFMRSTSNPHVFAAGDCADTGKPRLTPVANEEARIVVKNLFEDEPSHRPDYGAIPKVAFTVPAISAVGMSQDEAEKSHTVDVRHELTSTWGSVRKTGQLCAGYKLLIDRKSDLILGAHLLGPAAEETINLFALAMKHQLTATEIKSTLFAFPTFAADVRRMI